MAVHATYQEYRPPPDLLPWIACLWELTGSATDSRLQHRVLPDGCADVLIDLAAARRGTDAISVVGPMSAAVSLSLEVTLDVLGVRLRAGVVHSLFGVAADEILDRSVALTDLATPFRLEQDRLAEASKRRAWDVVIGALRRHLSRARPRDERFLHALAHWSPREFIDGDPRPPVSISRLVRDCGFSERTFQRCSLLHMGMAPARVRRLARFRAAMSLHAAGHSDWSELSATLGFADQAHLVRDFRAFAGLTPTSWAASQHSSVGFIQDGRVTAI